MKARGVGASFGVGCTTCGEVFG